MPRYDAVVVGAGVFGLATAYHILEAEPGQRILVVDKNPGPGMGNTARSAAAFREFFTSEINYKLARSSISYYTSLEEEGVDLGIRMVGYLWLESESSYEEKMQAISRLKHRLEYRVIDSREIEEELGLRAEVSRAEEGSLMGLSDVYCGIYTPRAGLMCSDRLVHHYYGSLREMGCEFMFNRRVGRILLEPVERIGIPGEPFAWQRVRAGGVVLEGGERIEADRVIVAAGAWTHQLMDAVGIDAHVRPKKRQVFVVKASTPELARMLDSRGISEEGMPFTILPGPRVCIRPDFEGRSFWILYSDDIGRPFALEEEPVAERNFYLKGIYHVLVQYFPQFLNRMPSNMWAGHYAYSTLDRQPVIFEEAGIVVVSGGSGSGIMKADAVGRVAAALYLGRRWARLFGGLSIRVSDLGIKGRRVEEERLVL
ncbi:hypothetical protein B6U99_02600 [Candidatus Geothermarchaeota archaeon ex4572_27]|nr:MAG: hypothetical protein B6U99_02600 [Candidatus Geothermarchaeota archaeon ex4572_27]